MAQRIRWGRASATGIVGVLIIAGLLLYSFGVVTNNSDLQLIGLLAIISGVVIGILYGILGIIGIVSKYSRGRGIYI